MLSSKRGVLEIFVSILNSVASGQLRKTPLTYRANLDSRLAFKYINSLIKLELVARNPKDSSYYMITQKGRNFLNLYNELIKMIEHSP